MKKRTYILGVGLVDGYDPIDPGTIPPEEEPGGINPGENNPPIEVTPEDGQSKTIMLIVAAAIALFLMTNKNR